MNLPQEYDEMKNVFGEPQSYNGLYIYPIRLKDYKHYDTLNWFNWNKNIHGNINYKKMSQLKFLLIQNWLIRSEVNNHMTPFDQDLIALFEYVFKKRIELYFSFSNDSKKILLDFNKPINIAKIYSDKLIGQIRFWVKIFDDDTEKFIPDTNFNIVKDVLLNQNCMPYDKLNIQDPGLFQTLTDALRAMSHKSDPIELWQQIINLSVALKIPFDELKEYTFYQFKMSMDCLDNLYEFSYFTPLELSGQVKAKKKGARLFTQHWMKNCIHKGIFDSVIVESQPVFNELKKTLKEKK
jgi:hypothetical protein